MTAEPAGASPVDTSGGQPPFERNAPYAPTPDNRPAPVLGSPLALVEDDGWQMSFGERAALQQILGELRPALAIEIGTAEGGSLERIAAASDEVHSIDLTHQPVRRTLQTNVVLHTGSSADVLPGLLDGFADSGRSVGFALVDGDHSFDGVRADLEVLLASPATRRSVILVHDTANPEVRAGIESVGLGGYDKVIYYELDFVPGYIYNDGIARGMIWGGLGLVMTGDRRSPAYAVSPRQTRYVEAFALIQRITTDRLAAEAGPSPAAPLSPVDPNDDSSPPDLRAELAAAQAQIARQAHVLDCIGHSRSWRLTAPARHAAALWRRRR